jgi:hypothetical protein
MKQKGGLFLFVALMFIFQAQARATQIIYVNQNAPVTSAHNGSSWANAYTDLQEAITNASPTASNPVEIWVAKGTYFPTTSTNRDASFVMTNNLRILGGFVGTENSDAQRLIINAFKTVLSGDINTRQTNRFDHTSPNPLVSGFGTPPDPEEPGFADNVHNVVTVVGVSNVVLDGVTIAGGYAYANAFRETNSSLLIHNMSEPALVIGTKTNIQTIQFFPDSPFITNIVVTASMPSMAKPWHRWRVM